MKQGIIFVAVLLLSILTYFAFDRHRSIDAVDDSPPEAAAETQSASSVNDTETVVAADERNEDASAKDEMLSDTDLSSSDASDEAASSSSTERELPDLSAPTDLPSNANPLWLPDPNVAVSVETDMPNEAVVMLEPEKEAKTIERQDDTDEEKFDKYYTGETSDDLGQNELQLIVDDAMAGNAEAQFTLGAISQRLGTEKGDEMAYVWYKMAANQGHEQATAALAALQETMSPELIAGAESKTEDAEATVKSNQEPIEDIQARDDQRTADITAIRDALLIYYFANGKTYPPGIPSGHSKEICKQGGDCTTKINLSILVTNGFLDAIPADPLSNDNPDSTLYLLSEQNGVITVLAPAAELSSTITVSTDGS